MRGLPPPNPLPVERYTGSLKKTIEYFGTSDLERFRFVTKFKDVESLLDAQHNGHTRFRFSINTPHVIRKYEHNTPPAAERIEAARKVAEAGYPLGFLIAPIILYPRWQEDYTELVHSLKKALGDAAESNITFELISHRFTARAKKRLLEVFPGSSLPLEEEERKFKYDQFGYGKYVYPKEKLQEVDSLFSRELERNFPGSRVEYLV